MKNNFRYILSVTVLAVLFHSGQVFAAQEFTIAGGSVGGTLSIFTEGAAEAIRRGNPDYIVTAEPGKDGPNCVILSQGKVHAAIAYYPTTVAALRAEDPYTSALPDMRILFYFPNHAFQIVATEKSGFTQLQDMIRAVKERRYPLSISVNKLGSLMETLTRAAFEVNGVTYDDIKKIGGNPEYNIIPEALDMMSTGKMDAVGAISDIPTTFYIEAASRMNLRLVELDFASAEKINAKLHTQTITVPAGTYSFQKQDVLTVGAPLVLIASANLPDEIAYSAIKAVGENLEYLRTTHVCLKDFTVEEMMGQGRETLVELHPGAAKWYKEYLASKGK